jgi:hypothetical protein
LTLDCSMEQREHYLVIYENHRDYPCLSRICLFAF